VLQDASLVNAWRNNGKHFPNNLKIQSLERNLPKLPSGEVTALRGDGVPRGKDGEQSGATESQKPNLPKSIPKTAQMYGLWSSTKRT